MHREGGILQHRIEIVAVGHRGHQPREGIGRRERKQQEAAADDTEHAQRARGEGGRQMAGVADQGHGPQREHQNPQQHRAFVRAPQRGDTVEQRQRRVGILGHVAHRKVVVDESVHQHADREGDEHELPAGSRGHHCEPAFALECRAGQAEEGLRGRKHQGKNQRVLAQFDDHQRASPEAVATTPAAAAAVLPGCAGVAPAAFRCSERATSGGMYFSSCLASTSSATKVPLASSRP